MHLIFHVFSGGSRAGVGVYVWWGKRSRPRGKRFALLKLPNTQHSGHMGQHFSN